MSTQRFLPYCILLGIIDLSFSYLLFTGQQYFSLFAMLGTFALALIAGILFVMPNASLRFAVRPEPFFALLFISIPLIIGEVLFDLVPAPFFGAALNALFLISISTIISIFGIHFLSKGLSSVKGKRFYVFAFLGLVLVSFMAYAVMYIANTVQWSGVDEIAYNYYASYLFVNGQNPYAASMKPILDQYHIFPTVQLNGTYEYAYSYPAFSFIPFIFIPLLGIKSFFSFIALLIFLTVSSSFAVYHRSDRNEQVLIPLAGWFVVSYALVGVITQYLAISVFLLLAYLYRHKPIAAGVFLGLAASTVQLAWFALPFFFILMLKDKGRRGLVYEVAASLLVFLAVNGYFLLTQQGSLASIFSLFGLQKLVFYGINLMQFAVAFYPLPFWYSAFMSVLTFLTLLALYHLYPKTLKPLLAVVPMMIFFLSWRNISIYGLPFIPLILAIYYWRDGVDHRDMLSSRHPIVIALVLLVLIGIVVAFLAHQAYVGGGRISVSRVIPIVYVQPGSSGLMFSLGGLSMNVSNTFDRNETVSFYFIGRSPNNEAYVLGSTLNQSRPHAVTSYSISYQLPLINNNTQVFVSVFSEDYASARILNFTDLGRNFTYPQSLNTT